MQNEKLFSDNPVNTGRQMEMDFAKSLAILAMVFVHILLFVPNTVDSGSIYAQVVNFFGCTPAAPVFMFCMGVGMVYSRHSDFASLFRRGLWLLFLAYLLNFLRGTLPLMVFSPWIDAGSPLLHASPPRMEWLRMFFSVDILQFAGLAFVFFAFVHYFRWSNATLLIVGLAIAMAELLIQPHASKNVVLNELIGLFIRVDHNSAFPFFSWIHFPIAGYLFGWLLQRCRNKTSLYVFLLLAGTLAFISLTLVAFRYAVPLGIQDEDVYYHQDFFQLLWGFSFILPWIGALYFLSLCVGEGILLNTIKRWSRNVNGIYIVHWIIIGWFVGGVFVMGVPKLNTLALAVLSLAILFASDFIVSCYGRWKAPKQ